MQKNINAAIIINYLKVNNLTQKEFCERCGIGVTTFRKILQGKTNYRFYAVLKLSKFFDCNLNDLFV